MAAKQIKKILCARVGWAAGGGGVVGIGGAPYKKNVGKKKSVQGVGGAVAGGGGIGGGPI